ncbi:histone-lysine N-methyltransferase SETMAR [Trichonephila clavipes]|nr:histone-lysine N-methyltransferase SETMAR [Trichonephila clavipes]
MNEQKTVKQFRTKKGAVQILQPPDLDPPDIFLFPRFKLALKGKRFDDIPHIQRNVTRHLNSIPKEDFLQSFQDMYRRSKWCIVMEGDYFKGQIIAIRSENCSRDLDKKKTLPKSIHRLYYRIIAIRSDKWDRIRIDWDRTPSETRLFG